MDPASVSPSAWQAWLPSLVAAGALGLVYVDMRTFKRQIAAQVEEVADTLKKALYRPDGQANYIPRGECEREQSRCRATLCSKIDSQTAILAAMDAKRDQQREAIFKELKDIAAEVGNLAGQLQRRTQ